MATSASTLTLTGYDFLSHVPEEIQEVIERERYIPPSTASLTAASQNLNILGPVRETRLTDITPLGDHRQDFAIGHNSQRIIIDTTRTPFYDSVTEVGSVNAGILESHVFEVSPFEIGTFEIGHIEGGSFKVSSPQISSFETGFLEVSPFEVSSFKVGIGQIDLNINIPENRSSQVSSFEIDSFEIGPFEVGSFKVNSIEDIRTNIESSTAEINSREISLSSSISLQQLLSSHFSKFHNQNPQINTLLHNTTIQITDLPPGQIAEAQLTQTDPTTGVPTAGTILIDYNANGTGWYIDPTPNDHSEYPLPLAEHAFLAIPSSPAYNRYDLLTAINHEFLHLLGAIAGHEPNDQYRRNSQYSFTLDGSHLNPILHPHDLGNPSLQPGQRLLFSEHDLHILEEIYGHDHEIYADLVKDKFYHG